MQAMVEITYLVDVNGVVSIDKTRTLSPEEVKNNDVPKKEMITIIAYATRPVNGGPSIPASSPWQTKNQKRLTKAYKNTGGGRKLRQYSHYRILYLEVIMESPSLFVTVGFLFFNWSDDFFRNKAWWLPGTVRQ